MYFLACPVFIMRTPGAVFIGWLVNSLEAVLSWANRRPSCHVQHQLFHMPLSDQRSPLVVDAQSIWRWETLRLFDAINKWRMAGLLFSGSAVLPGVSLIILF